MRPFSPLPGGSAVCAVLLLLLLPASEALADLIPDWVRRFDLNQGDSIAGVVTDANDNIYVTSTTSQTNPTVIDILTLKFAPDGTLLWFTTYDGPSSHADGSVAITLDPAGDLLVLGSSEGDFLVLKYRAADGSLIWASQHDGGNNPEGPNAFTTDASGSIFVTGFTRPSGADHQEDFYTYKMDSLGNVLWTATYDGPFGAFLFNCDEAVDVALDSSGDVVVTGPSNFGSTPQYVTIKYRGTDGSQIWLDRFDSGPGTGGVPVDLEIDGQDDVYVTGIAVQGGRKWFGTIKIRNADGVHLWEGLVAPSLRNSVTSLALDSQGDVYVAGAIDRDGDLSNFNDNLLVVHQRGSDGALLWRREYGQRTVGHLDLANDIAVDSAGSVYVTGATSSFGAVADLLTARLDAATGAVTDLGVFDPGAGERAVGGFAILDSRENLVVGASVRNDTTFVSDILMLKYPRAEVCQTDIGFGGPGASALSVCGGDLSAGTTANLRLMGAPPSTTAFLFAGLVNAPTPVKGGLLVPVPWTVFITSATDNNGSLLVPGISGGGGPLSMYVQVVVRDPAQALGFDFSNAVRVDFLP